MSWWQTESVDDVLELSFVVGRMKAAIKRSLFDLVVMALLHDSGLFNATF
jgi:hypothetical protein